MWSEYKGRRYLDIRVYTEIEGKADKVPTEKGVTLWPDLTPELIKALRARSRDHADTRVLAVVSFSNSAPPKDRLAVSAPIGARVSTLRPVSHGRPRHLSGEFFGFSNAGPATTSGVA